MSAPDAGPPPIDMHPAAFALVCIAGAALWVGSFKLAALALRALGGGL